MDALTRDRRREIRALLVLDQLPGVGPRRLRRGVERVGSGVAALALPDEGFQALFGTAAAAGRNDPAVGRRVDTGLRTAEEAGVVCLHWGDPAYPARLHNLADPPAVLFLRGDPALLASPGVAVVGARRATARARDVSRRLGAALAARGTTVVSGLALGVDGAAHRGALDVGGPTVAVVATGAEAAYPRSHRRLCEGIARHGLVVSEFLPDTPALPHHFPRRNRILAALAHTVVVVEAGARSGSLITVDHALDLGLDVWAVPGPIDQAGCSGSNALLTDGARPLVSVESFAARVAPGTCPELRAPGTSDGSGSSEVSGGADGGRVLAVLGSEALPTDEVSRRAGLPIARTLVALSALEMGGRVERRPGARFRRAG
ncbi:MAG: DNA-processing protein DprA [Longimicrobiales bacterium]